MVTARNPVYSVLYLILGFFNAAGLFVLLGAELLAMLLVIVYVGAVAVLFLFVVMMLNINFVKMKEGFVRYLPLALLVATILFAELFFVIDISTMKLDLASQAVVARGEVTNAEAIGRVLYTDYVLLFQLAGMILLVAMIGAIVLTHRQREGVRKQKIEQQLARNPKRSIRMVDVKVGKGA